MTVIEFATLLLLAVVTAIGTWRLLRRHRQRELEAGRDPRSGSFASAAASTLLALKIDPLVRAGSVIFMPVGDGLYLTRTNPTKAKAWMRTLGRWMSCGATIHVIVTVPNAEARKAWRRFESQNSARFHYYELDRGQAEPDLAREIARLDTYHPILLVNETGDAAPGAMWIEQYHPLDSSYAYAVQYVAPAETKTDGRFEVFQSLYDRLLKGSHARAGTQALPEPVRRAA